MIKRTLLSAGFACILFAGRAQLQWPVITAQTKPWTRWWWMGSAVDKKNLTLNMESYRAAGLGGLELTPIYGVKGYENTFIDYLSPGWMEMLGHTLSEAKRLGLGLDMSAGTGWPFGGGPLIDSVYACKELFYKTWTVKGGTALTDTVRFVSEPLVHTDGRAVTIDQLVEPVFANKDLQSLALFQVRFPRSLPLQALMAYSSAGAVVDLTGKVDAGGRLLWTAPSGSDWTLYGLFQGLHGKMVERAAPGAEGNVIDHFSSAALRKYLSRFDTAFAGRDLSGLRCFFNDSYEVDDSRGQGNWTPGFFAAFQAHRGYDLRQHLPELFGKDKDNRVLCDYRETISDLLLEQFTKPWGDWAHSKGALIRNQAHGSPANILDLYAVSDIPETEGGDIFWYKFGTSAAHVTGKKLASSESVTWLDEHFLSSLSDVKKALDNYLAGGVNHIFYHGTAYSPVGEAWPGWLFYASVHFTPNDPSWKDFPVLNQYVARCQSFLQQGAPDNDVLLYYPVYDSWSEPGTALLKHYDRMESEFNGTGFMQCAQVLQNKGYTFDYISDQQLQQTRFDSAIVTSGGGHYQTVVLPANRYISAAVMQKLVQLAEGGANILVYRSMPGGVPGYGHAEEEVAFKQLLSRLSFSDTREQGIRIAPVGKGSFLLADDLSRMLAYAHIRRESMADDSLDFVRRNYGSGKSYFIVNHGAKKWAGWLPLSATFRSAAIFDPMTGNNGLAVQQDHKVYLQLLPGESCLLQLSGTVLQAPLFAYYKPAASPITVTGSWKIRFTEGGPSLPKPVTVDHLGSWTTLGGEETRAFCGTAIYTIVFRRPAVKTADWLLDLGKVDRTAEVVLNGRSIARLIGPDYRVVLPASALAEKNTLEVRVSNGMANRIADMDRKGMVWKKFYNTNFPAHERANRGANGLFDASKWTPMDSGLSGPVTITPLQDLHPESENK